MDKIDPRLYYEGHKPTVVEESAVGGRRYCIASLGRYPVAYLTCTAKELEAVRQSEGDAPCHGGITFCAEADSEALPPALGAYGFNERPKCPDPFIGWDYGYGSDYRAGDGDAHGKIWTVGGIREDVWAVAKWLDGLTVDDARRRWLSLGCPLTAIPIGNEPTVAINLCPGFKIPKLATVEVVKTVLADGRLRPYFEYRYTTADGEERTGRALLSAYGWEWAESAEAWGRARAWRMRGAAIPQ